ncbi:hypothetical protein B296_00057593 [Ensete ventricosum]|uniref:Uncharacterized protein n=1 Tax=Ensete ventricosum TaxID=4639 RepID=A0A426XB61_ENSVE|nr:hypothetical protein B296_00057593 [Ensete ventricosum]
MNCVFLSRYCFTIFLDCVDDFGDSLDNNERRFAAALHHWQKVAALRDKKHMWHSQVLELVTARGDCWRVRSSKGKLAKGVNGGGEDSKNKCLLHGLCGNVGPRSSCWCRDVAGIAAVATYEMGNSLGGVYEGNKGGGELTVVTNGLRPQ